RSNLRETAWKDLRQRALQVVIVERRRLETEQRPARAKIDVHAVARHWNRPEQSIRGDMRIVVVNLLSEIGRSNWTVVDVQSDESKCGVVVFAVNSYVFADHEPHVRLERKRGEPCTAPAASNAVQPDKAVEIGDLRQFVEVRQRCARVR